MFKVVDRDFAEKHNAKVREWMQSQYGRTYKRGGHLYANGDRIAKSQENIDDVITDISANPVKLFTPEYNVWRNYLRNNSDYVNQAWNSMTDDEKDYVFHKYPKILTKEQEQQVFNKEYYKDVDKSFKRIAPILFAPPAILLGAEAAPYIASAAKFAYPFLKRGAINTALRTGKGFKSLYRGTKQIYTNPIVNKGANFISFATSPISAKNVYDKINDRTFYVKDDPINNISSALNVIGMIPFINFTNKSIASFADWIKYKNSVRLLSNLKKSVLLEKPLNVNNIPLRFTDNKLYDYTTKLGLMDDILNLGSKIYEEEKNRDLTNSIGSLLIKKSE